MSGDLEVENPKMQDIIIIIIIMALSLISRRLTRIERLTLPLLLTMEVKVRYLTLVNFHGLGHVLTLVLVLVQR